MHLSETGFFKKAIRLIAILAFLFSALAPVSCEKNTLEDAPAVDYYPDRQEDAIPSGEEPKEKDDEYTKDLENSEQEQNNILSQDELLRYKPNELGQVMVLMYHQIGDTESEWMRTPQNFRKDLINLYQNGYRLVNLLDYVRGNIDIEAGKSPVIITFDDATQGQLDFQETSQGFELDPDCAVAILEDFCSDYPDFGRGATFYIYYPNPFRQEQHIEDKLKFLARKGYEIGNHTYSHANLSLLSDEDALMEIALNGKKTNDFLPGYEVRSLSLPYGQYPNNRDILAGGNYMEYNYTNEAVLLVGSNPAPSPFSIEFDPSGIPRIRASETMVENSGIYDWLNFFKKYPERQYISDGNTAAVAVPREAEDSLDKHSTVDKMVYFY
ncbi:MAG: polysaccharide deacetylase family protein [Actinomycetota bacterium]